MIMAKPCACIFNYSVSDLHLLEYNGFDQEMWELNRKVRQFKYFTDGAVQRHSCPWQLSAYEVSSFHSKTVGSCMTVQSTAVSSTVECLVTWYIIHESKWVPLPPATFIFSTLLIHLLEFQSFPFLPARHILLLSDFHKLTPYWSKVLLSETLNIPINAYFIVSSLFVRTQYCRCKISCFMYWFTSYWRP